MQPLREAEGGTITPLEEIRQLFLAGDTDNALKKVDAYLVENPNDLEAQFVKAEIGLTYDKYAVYIADALPRLEAVFGASDRFQDLQEKVSAAVELKLKQGHAAVEAVEYSKAVSHFQAAIELSGKQAGIALAAALALLTVESIIPAKHVSRRRTPFDELDDILQHKKGIKYQDTDQAAIQIFLEIALENSQPGDPVFDKALVNLTSYHLKKKQVAEALNRLTSVETLPVDAASLVTEVCEAAFDIILENIAGLLENGQESEAERILQMARDSMLFPYLINLLQAEIYLRQGESPKAIACYEQMLVETIEPERVLPSVKELWDMVAQTLRVCANCINTNAHGSDKCSFCNKPLDAHPLLTGKYWQQDLSAEMIAHTCIADLLHNDGALSAALIHLDMVLATVSGAKNLRMMRAQWQAELERQQQAAAVLQLVNQAINAPTLNVDLLNGVSRLATDGKWLSVSVPLQIALLRCLIGDEHMLLARQLMHTATAEVAQVVVTEFERAAVVRVQAIVDTLRQKQTPFEETIQFAEEALTLQPEHIEVRLLCGEAYLAAGHATAALSDFRMVYAAHHSEFQDRACLGIAQVLEHERDVDGARDILAQVSDAQSRPILERLDRLQRYEPCIAVQQLPFTVMHDTLTRTENLPTFTGIFAVAVRAVGRPWSTSAEQWYQQLLTAGFEFVQILGGLGHTTGAPVFAIRLISRPHAALPERGQITLALLVRVSADSAQDCQDIAMQHWYTIRDILPAAQQYAFSYEPVVDEQELAWLLEPFTADQVSEIIRREDSGTHNESPYVVYPFVAGTPDLHNLCWGLLRQKTPVMLSIHLLPTALLPWEQTALAKAAPPYAANVGNLEVSAPSLEDPIALWWQSMPRLGKLQRNREQSITLSAQAYLLRVNIAGTAEMRSIVPDLIASTMFGPIRQIDHVPIGGYQIMYPVTDEEAAIARHNLATLDVESWGYNPSPSETARLRYLVGEHEAAVAFRLPIPTSEGVPGVPITIVKPAPPSIGMPSTGTVLGESIARVGGTPTRIRQGSGDRRRHTYIVGKTGVGKTTLMQAMALQDIEAGHGVCVVDPHGDLIDDILVRIPPHRAADVILFDPSDLERPVGLNLLNAKTDAEKNRIATEFIGLLVRMYDPSQQGIVGPRFQHNVRNAMLTVMSVEGSTLIEVVRVLTDSAYLKQILPSVTDPLVRNYWEKQIASTSDFHKSEVLDYIVSKFSHFVGDRLVRNIIGQRESTIDFRQIMDKRQILLVNLSKGKIGAEGSQFLGLLLVQSLLIAALSRADSPADQRPDFFLYVDEFQNFATELFGTVLSEGRKYGVSTVIANQYLTQLDSDIRDAIFGNVGSMMCFRLGIQDASALLPEMYPVFGLDDLLNLPRYTACVKLLVDGVASRPFTMRTIPDLRPVDKAAAERIRQTSRQLYGKDALLIGEDILARFAST
ncbi:MAG: type IV secretion system DNA-binding domain-containing protein [Chloroflexota bacterium]